MRFRKLRIAFSATCLIAWVLLIALWVRSYWWIDSIGQCENKSIFTAVGSQWGYVYFAHVNWPGNSYRSHGWEYHTHATERRRVWEHLSNGIIIYLPHWFCIT